jgi:hypothetical protein
MNEADTIRAAFAVIGADAPEAPDVDRIHGVLAYRARRARQRRVVLRVAGAGAAAVVVGGAALGVREVLGGRPGPAWPEIAGGPGGGWVAVPWRFEPGWLPWGYGEARFGMVVMGDQVPVASRSWMQDGSTIEVMVGWHDSMNRPSGATTSVVVGGVRGDLIEGDGGTYVTWQPPGQPTLTVAVVGGPADDSGQWKGSPALWRSQALHVAGSLRHDPGHGYVGTRFGYLPPQYAGRPWSYSVGYVGSAWYQNILVTSADGNSQLLIDIGPHAYEGFFDESQAAPSAVRGVPGWTIAEANQVFVTLDDGREIMAQGGRDLDVLEVLRVVDDLDVGPIPDMTWVGTRP